MKALSLSNFTLTKSISAEVSCLLGLSTSTDTSLTSHSQTHDLGTLLAD